MRGARHSLLREATSGRHQALDRDVTAAGYFKSRSAYASYLQRIAEFHAWFDPEVAREAPDLFARWHIGCHAQRLSDDLRALGGAGLQLHRPHTRHIALQRRAQAIGGLYVVIGSSLGARVLRTWAADLQLPPDAGLAYLSHLAASRAWPEFLDLLESEPDLDEAALVDGALATFDAVHRHLAERQLA